MVRNNLDYASRMREAGHPVVGILCEYTPRELIMAAGGLPACLCGGSAETIPAAEKELPSNLCPLIKSTYGYHASKANPFLEMASLVVAETTCDGKKKMLELMAESRPMHVLALPQKQNDPDARAEWERELRKFRAELERRFERKIADSDIREAIHAMNRERALRRELAALMKRDPPPMTGRQLLDYRSIICCIPEDLEQYARARDLLGRNGGNAALKGRPRVLLTGVPTVHGAERVVELIEERGGVVVCMENCTGLRPILNDVDPSVEDPITALADKYYNIPCSVMTRNDRRFEQLAALAREYRADCIVELIWHACLTYDVESWRTRKVAEEELHVPYLQIETDYSPSDSARIAVRLEALFEMTRQRKKP